MAMGSAPCFDGVAGEDITPSRFVKLGTNHPKEILMCDTQGERAFGVSQCGTRRVPLTGLDDGFAAKLGESISVFGHGQPAWLEGGAVIAFGALVTTGATGKGETAASLDFVNAQAIQNCDADGRLFLVNVLGPQGAALA